MNPSIHPSGDSKASERVLTQLLTELDGVQPLKRVVVVAATNRPDIIDPALMRPGRIDRKIYVPPPDRESRMDILKLSLKKMPYEEGILDFGKLADLTEGFSGAEVVTICREAAMIAIERDLENASSIDMSHLSEAIGRWKPQITESMLSFYRNFQSS